MSLTDRISGFEAGAITALTIAGVINYTPGDDVNLLLVAVILLALSLLFE